MSADGRRATHCLRLKDTDSCRKNYSQLEKELDSVNRVWSKKFHQYLYGGWFTLFTDHRPLTLTTIFSSKRGVPPLVAAHLPHWFLFLISYGCDIESSTSAHANVDCLSRLSLYTYLKCITSSFYFHNPTD